jgi:electron transport complex protein RnfE
MGLSAMVVLIASNASISLVKRLIPDKVRIPAYITLIATFVTILEYLLHAYVPSLYDSLGLFIPLIVVNCIILGRAEAFAARNSPLASIIDGISMGLGFTLALGLLGSIREILGAGTIFNIRIIPQDYNIIAFILAPGAFITLGFLIAVASILKEKQASLAKKVQEAI